MELDTIFAMATASGRAAVAVMRLSGPRAGAIVGDLAGGLPPPRHASLRRLRASGGEVLDRALVLWFPGPRSYSGEDMAELHLHGSHAVGEAVAAALLASGGRPAEPGEFTRRAFLHGRMDLTEAEGIADLIEAETSAQRRQALRQMDGALGALYRDWSTRLTRLVAHAEAEIDFPDDDLPADLTVSLRGRRLDLQRELAAHLADEAVGERVRRGVICAIVGPPNVGKSSLINRLAGRDVAIVADRPGTTRDPLEARVVLAGVPVTLVDTAGLRDSEDPVEREGVRRALARAEAADLVLRVHDARRIEGSAPAHCMLAGEVQVANKADLVKGPIEGCDCAVSALTGKGMAELRGLLETRIGALTRAGGAVPLTRVRHRAALDTAARHLAAADTAPYTDMCAEELRLALRAIGGVTGEVSVEALLDLVFRDFCIGK